MTTFRSATSRTFFSQVTQEQKSKANPADDDGDDELLFHESRFDDCRC